MKHEQVEFLQDKLVQEAAAMIALAGSETKVEEYEQAIKLVGKAWGSDQSEVDKWLNLIQQERTAAAAAANGMPANHIMPERDLLLNWTGTECIDVMEALFETAVQLNEKDDRCTLFNMAMTLMECQNLMDWVERRRMRPQSSRYRLAEYHRKLGSARKPHHTASGHHSSQRRVAPCEPMCAAFSGWPTVYPSRGKQAGFGPLSKRAGS